MLTGKRGRQGKKEKKAQAMPFLAEGMNPLVCARGRWRREEGMPVVSPELHKQGKSVLTSFFCYSILLPVQGAVSAGSKN